MNTHQVDNIQESIFNIVYLVVKKMLIEVIGNVKRHSKGDSIHDTQLVGKSSTIEEWKRNKDYDEIYSNLQLLIFEFSKSYGENSEAVRSYLDYALRDISYDLMMNIEI